MTVGKEVRGKRSIALIRNFAGVAISYQQLVRRFRLGQRMMCGD
jgi:hypothetical protein